MDPTAQLDRWPPVGPSDLGTPTTEERTWALLSHLSVFVLGIIGPVVILLTKGRDSAFVTEAAVEALNFQVTAFIAVIVAAVLVEFVVGMVLVLAVVAAVVFTAGLAALAAHRGEPYRYPICLRVIQ